MNRTKFVLLASFSINLLLAALVHLRRQEPPPAATTGPAQETLSQVVPQPNRSLSADTQAAMLPFGPLLSPGLPVAGPTVPVAASCEAFVDFFIGAHFLGPAQYLEAMGDCKALPPHLASAEAEFRTACEEAKQALSRPPEGLPSPGDLELVRGPETKCINAVRRLQQALAVDLRANKPISELTDVRVLIRLQESAGAPPERVEIAKRLTELLPNDVRAAEHYVAEVSTTLMFRFPADAPKPEEWQSLQALIDKQKQVDPSHPYFEEMDLWTRTRGYEANLEEALAEHQKRYPNSGFASYKAGILAAKSGDMASAERYFRQALEKEPREGRYRINLEKLKRQEPVEDFMTTPDAAVDELLPPMPST